MGSTKRLKCHLPLCLTASGLCCSGTVDSILAGVLMTTKGRLADGRGLLVSPLNGRPLGLCRQCNFDESVSSPSASCPSAFFVLVKRVSRGILLQVRREDGRGVPAHSEDSLTGNGIAMPVHQSHPACLVQHAESSHTVNAVASVCRSLVNKVVAANK